MFIQLNLLQVWSQYSWPLILLYFKPINSVANVIFLSKGLLSRLGLGQTGVFDLFRFVIFICKIILVLHDSAIVVHLKLRVLVAFTFKSRVFQDWGIVSVGTVFCFVVFRHCQIGRGLLQVTLVIWSYSCYLVAWLEWWKHIGIGGYGVDGRNLLLSLHHTLSIGLLSLTSTCRRWFRHLRKVLLVQTFESLTMTALRFGCFLGTTLNVFICE